MTDTPAAEGTPVVTNEHAALLIKAPLSLIKQILIRHTTAILEEMSDRQSYAAELEHKLAAANRRIAELEGYNVGLADEIRIVRGALDDLVDAIDGSADMDEMDGPEYKVAQDRLEAALTAARYERQNVRTRRVFSCQHLYCTPPI